MDELDETQKVAERVRQAMAISPDSVVPRRLENELFTAIGVGFVFTANGKDYAVVVEQV